MMGKDSSTKVEQLPKLPISRHASRWICQNNNRRSRNHINSPPTYGYKDKKLASHISRAHSQPKNIMYTELVMQT
jgi:hypothetical protein